MLAVHTSNLGPGLTMQQANPHRSPCASSNNKPLITGAPPQLIPMATVPQSQFLIRSGYTLLPPIAPLTNMNVDSFSGLTPLGGLTRPITAIPYYSPTDVYQRGSVGGASVEDNAATPGLRSSTLSAPSQSTPTPSSSPPSLPSVLMPLQVKTSVSGISVGPSGGSPVNETSSCSQHISTQTSLPDSLNLASPIRRRPPSPAGNLSATTPDQTPQAATPHLVMGSPLNSSKSPSSNIKREPKASEEPFTNCTVRPKSADAVADESSAFPSSSNPYPINALIDAPTSLGRCSRTSSLSSSISSFRFGGSLNKLWASQLSLSNKVNTKSTGSLNTEAATMPSLGNQYIALGGSLPELSLTSLTRLLPNSSANDAANATQHGLFTLVHHPAPLYVYSSQQHLATPFINPNGSITFGSFLSAGSSLCNPVKSSSSEKSEVTDEGDDKCLSSEVKPEKQGGECTNGGVQSSMGSVLSSAANYSPITAHMIQPSTHATLNRAVPVMALPTFGTICNVNTQLGSSPPHPGIIPHVTPYSPLITTSTSSQATAHPSCIVATPTSLDISTEAPPSHHSPTISSATIGHASLSPIHTSDNKEGVLRQIGVPPPSDLYLGGPSMNGMHGHTKLEGDSALTPTSEDHQTPQAGVKHEKDRPYKCDHPGCERSFSFPAHLRSHIQQIHISYRPCKCEFPGCGKRFYTPQHLNVHRRVHTGERPFVCPYPDCCKAFTTAGNLKNHIRTHTGERPYACKFEGCTKRFAEMSSLKKHELTHTGEKPYKCRVCGKAFSQAGSRNTHERKHNRTEGEEVNSEGKVGRRYRIKRVTAGSSSFESDQN